MNPGQFQSQLLTWYQAHKRELPWRENTDPYRVWVSEIMLQQTQVDTVRERFTHWMGRFPQLSDLAAAPVEEVLKEWEGLGYYSRARNIHKAAVEICRDHNGQIPGTYEEVLALPGIGRYTAGAVLSIAFGKPVPLVDGNVIRVLSRVALIEDEVSKASVQKQIWALAQSLVPKEAPGDFNQGLMELGATVCTPAHPACESCPVANLCKAKQHGRQSALPVTRPRPKTVQMRYAAALIRADGRILLRYNAPGQLWAGLWDLPQVETQDSAEPDFSAVCGTQTLTGALVGEVRYSFTHHHARRKLYCAEIVKKARLKPPLEWIPEQKLKQTPLAGPAVKSLKLAGILDVIPAQAGI
ncbi:MAG: A/G-specific adenine glycosylase [Candidatus Omnitrophica bacterium]|nr:A/G-specific adenine glycosylase [Candidatus Omnitrophota bacterium]